MANYDITGQKQWASPADGAGAPSCLLRLPAVLERVGLRRSRLYDLIAEGDFPQPVKLSVSGRAVAWHATEIDAWCASRPRAQVGKYTGGGTVAS